MTLTNRLVGFVLTHLRAAVLGLGLLALCSAADAELADQPYEKHSTLIDVDGRPIRDDDFAQWMRDLLVGSDDASLVRDAKFLFQECYGGGMLDDLQTQLGDKVTWVGGSASKHDECSTGQVSTAENDARPARGLKKYADRWVKDPPEDYWTEALKGELAGQKLEKAIEKASSKDGANSDTKRETGQSVVRNGGEEISLADPDAASHHAILWAGEADSMRHFNDISNVWDALVDQWDGLGVPVTVTVLFGDGVSNSEGTALPPYWDVKKATKENLRKAILDLYDDIDFKHRNEQFFFYASDHGGRDTDITGPPVMVLPAIVSRSGATQREFHTTFSLAPGELTGMRLQPDNLATLTVDYSGVVEPGAVSFALNGALLGSLDPNSTTIEFAVDEDALRGDNEVLVVSTNPSPFEIVAMQFFTGGIDTNPPKTLSKNQQSCVKGLTSGGQAIAQMQNAANRSCVKNAGKGKESDPEQCLTADPTGKMQKQINKTLSDGAKRCSEIPNFGATHADAVVAATRDESLNFVHDVFGPDLSTGQISSENNAPSCQDKVIQRAGQVFDTKLSEFVTCQTKALREADTYHTLEACVEDQGTAGSIAADTKGRIAKRRAQLGSDIAKNCGGVNTCAAFLGPCTCLTGDALSDCVDTLADCRVCLTINRMDNLAVDCDLFDDGAANLSCPPRGSTTADGARK